MEKDYDRYENTFSKHKIVIDQEEYDLLVEELESYKDRCFILEQEMKNIERLNDIKK